MPTQTTRCGAKNTQAVHETYAPCTKVAPQGGAQGRHLTFLLLTQGHSVTPLQESAGGSDQQS